jgi:acyl-CoA thioester hydrolase
MAPLTHTRHFRIRAYECDAYGHLNNANYLRLMQEAAFDASAAAGYDNPRYEEIGYYWLIHETGIEYLQPAVYNDVVALKTWVADFRRVTSRRSYEFYREGDENLIARAYTDWAFMDRATNRPALIPGEMIEAFWPDGLSETPPPRPPSPFPNQPPRPTEVFKTRRKVVWHEIDTMMHVNNAVYPTYAEECGYQSVAAYGWPLQRLTEVGHAILIRRARIEYLQPAVLDDELEISTWIYNVRMVSAMRHYDIHRIRDGALLARIDQLGAWVDLANGRPGRIPVQFLEDFGPNIASGTGDQ